MVDSETEEKAKFHPSADEKNWIIERQGRRILACGAQRKRVKARCRNRAGMGTNHTGWGRCKFCAGLSTGPKTEEGKAAAAANSRKHGFYSNVLSPAERIAYEEQRAVKSLSLEDEIYLQKAKIAVYLADWRRKWDSYYKRKLAEKYVKYRCTAPDCDGFHVRGDLEQKPGYCNRCGEKHLEEVERWVANRTPEDAERYADSMTKVYYSEGEGARSFYHAGSLEDRTLDRALNTLSRMVEKHARLNSDQGDDLLGAINAELRAASRGKVSISWGGPAQKRLTTENAK
ncbi:hypothetical protein M5X11_17530 [Paenibacillus alginolyticus]|uniref:hypothetical protein n=1 Tax=Paenibacillus alginolyticus TaxID=59839 RepID=UPI0004171578|nr:hypothetical protein [Paenibacillus alginolyticus]MCY9666707.1 hypothetical protein [Paenibacillus alginolyticus]